MSNRTATSNHFEDQKFQAGKEIGMNIISRGAGWETKGEKWPLQWKEEERPSIDST